ncbi:hypothetical protein ACFWG5_12060 [Streptomyces hydrogenans]|uniref:hypothetical protein n=1 Tax=Streptomyces hydrogenans TaxID=1873719 RepID=UPI0036467389
MGNYVLTYHGGDEPATQADADKIMQTWIAWFAALGNVVVDAGAPISRSVVISDGGLTYDHSGPQQTTGYSILSADSLEAAIILAKGCPHLSAGGTVEVGEAMA